MLTHYYASLVAGLLAAPPDPAPSPPPGLEETGTMFIAWMKWVLWISGVAGLLGCGVMMAVGRRNRSSWAADGAAGVPWVVAGLTCGAVAAVVVAAVLPG